MSVNAVHRDGSSVGGTACVRTPKSLEGEGVVEGVLDATFILRMAAPWGNYGLNLEQAIVRTVGQRACIL